jgi:hypothetical protein
MIAGIKRAAVFATLYLACWITAHCLLFLFRGEGLGLQYLSSYFIAAWTFSAGELPTFIWFGSLLLFGLVLLAWFMRNKLNRSAVA